jgi:hypothetical protein
MLQQRVAMGTRPAAATARRCHGVPALPASRAGPRPCAALRLPQQPAPLAAAAPRRAPLRCAAAAAGAGAAPLPAQPAPPAAAPAVGVKIVPALISIGLGFVVNFIVPTPEGVSAQAWRLFSIFISTICGE